MMVNIPFVKRYKLASILLLGVLSGCASVNIDEALQKTNLDSSKFTNGQVVLAKSSDERNELKARAKAHSKRCRSACLN